MGYFLFIAVQGIWRVPQHSCVLRVTYRSLNADTPLARWSSQSHQWCRSYNSNEESYLHSKSIPGLSMGCPHHYSWGLFVMASTPSTRRNHKESLHFWTRGYMGEKHPQHSCNNSWFFNSLSRYTFSAILWMCSERIKWEGSSCGLNTVQSGRQNKTCCNSEQSGHIHNHEDSERVY